MGTLRDALADIVEAVRGIRVENIEAAADDGFPCYLYFARDPNLDPLRDFPRFVDFMSQLHEQWRHFQQIA